jgi:hypothetical protein
MNIFAVSTCPIECAKALDDKRLIQAVTQVAVILSTALHLMGCGNSSIYKAEYQGHPWTVWATKARGNFQWLVLHGLALNEEMRYRFPDMKGKERSTKVILDCSELFLKCPLDVLGMTPFPNCTNLTGNVGVVKLYRQFMTQTKWGFQTRWTLRGMPEWHRETLPKEAA